MPVFKYEGTTQSGQFVSGVVDAFDEMEALGKAREACHVVSKITRERAQPEFLKKEVGGDKIKDKTLSLMCSQFANIIGAGMSTSRCVELIANQTEDKNLAAILKEVAADVNSGHSLADSFQSKAGNKMPIILYETIRAGELAGTLDESFKTLKGYFDKSSKNRARLVSALIYPAFVCVLAVVVVIVMMVAVVPTFKEILSSYDADMPAMTQVLIDVSDFVAAHWLVMLLVIAVVVFVFMLWKRTERGSISWARLKMRMPVVGKITLASNSATFANTMSLLLGTGLPVTQAVDITSRVLTNKSMSKGTGNMVHGLEEGRRLAECMREVDGYPAALVEMAAVGEETGSIEDTLGTMGTFYDEETNRLTQDAISKLEPAVLVFIALFAGYIVIALYIAMFSMYSAM